MPQYCPCDTYLPSAKGVKNHVGKRATLYCKPVSRPLRLLVGTCICAYNVHKQASLVSARKAIGICTQ
eukprot:scaffold66816_cov19-Tisochrysis_lutea.AAC.2